MRWLIRVGTLVIFIAIVAIVMMAKVEKKETSLAKTDITDIKRFQDEHIKVNEPVTVVESSGGVDYSGVFFIEGVHHFVNTFDYETELKLICTLRERIKTLEGLEKIDYENSKEELLEWYGVRNKEDFNLLSSLSEDLSIGETTLKVIPVTISPDRQIWDLELDGENKLQMRITLSEDIYYLYIEPKGGWS